MTAILGISADRRLLVTALLVTLFAMIASRDITRGYSGLHCYSEAHAAWAARAHLNYGLKYTLGFATFAVGNPPPAHPARYLDHPPLPGLLDAVVMAMFGENEWALRLSALLVYALSLPLLLRLLRSIFDETTAVLAVLLFILFPITGYFYCTAVWWYWNLPLVILAWWNYLALIGALRDVRARPSHQWWLGIVLFILVQHNWVGLFYAAAIGTHYVGHCLGARRFPDRRLFLILLLSPLASLIADFLVLLAVDAWDYYRLIGLYEFRSSMRTGGRTATGWLIRQWQFLRANFTLPIVVLIVGYIVHSLTARIAVLFEKRTGRSRLWKNSRPFPYAWLFVMPGILNIVVFRELFWEHQFQYIPFSICIAVLAALAILRLRDALLARSRLLATIVTATVMVVIIGASAQGLNRYYARKQYPPEVLDIFKRLNREIPPDGSLLSYRDYIIRESPFKPAFYRPEVAWSLDRRIAVATTADEVDHVASKGGSSFYFADVPPAPMALVEDLKARYPYEFFKGYEFSKGVDYDDGPPTITYPDHYLFDLRHPLAPRTDP